MTLAKLLIANRAEIAIRIARAAAELGIRTVAIHPDDDAGSAHVGAADEAVRIPGGGAAAYLDIASVIRSARDAGCDAIHPGYGFLSENADFARGCHEAGLTFVGPTPDLIALFGDKVRARELAAGCDVPVPQGRAGPVTLAEAGAFLASLGGGAMMVKAISGGGGRGIRVVRDEAGLAEAFERCRSEARAASGQDGLYVEEFVEDARHIEIQVVGDGRSVRHLWERECSLQRRQQKLVEIAPSPSLREDLRDRIAEAATRMAHRTRYLGLGTFEFLVRRNPGPAQAPFLFIEGNPRLQVEHTVTEAVTGLDLVKAQLRIAGGADLDAAGVGVTAPPKPRGYAIQLRIGMESVDGDGTVRPAAGTISRFEMPSGPGVRVDTFGRVGYRTSMLYDPLLAKVIVHADADFGTAVAKATRALRETRIGGVATNRALLAALLADPAVVANDVDTTFIERNLPRLAREAAATETPSAASPDGPDAEPDRSGPAAADGPAGSAAVPAPLDGRIAAVEVRVGDTVRAGQTLAVVEAMKMESPIASPVPGTVSAVAVRPGDIVATGTPLVFVTLSEAAEAVHEDDREARAPEDVRPDLLDLFTRLGRVHDAGRPGPVERRHARGGRTARENVADLCDPDSFLEYGALVLPVQRSRFSRDELIEKGPADGLVAGIGRINAASFGDEAARVAVMAYDYTAFAGTQGIMAHKKKDRLLEIAERERLPVVVFAEGGGGRPGDGDAVDVTGVSSRTFWRFARLSGAVPLVAIVSGRCFAGNAAMAGCSDVIIATRNTTIGMAGPAMIEGGGLGVVSPDEVGPVSVQAPNGVIDVVVADEAEAVEVARRYLSYVQGTVLEWDCADQRRLRAAIPENRRRVYDTRALVDGLCDTGSVLELRRAFAPGMLTCLARIEGRPLGIVANDPKHLGGAIDSDGAEKASRFMRLCDSYGLPVLSLCDTPGFMVGPQAEKTAAVRHMSRMFLAGAGLSVPFLTVVLRKAYGLGAMAMAAGSTAAPILCVAWPTGEFGSMGPEGAVHLAYRRELAAVEGDERRALFNRLVEQIYDRGRAIEVAGNFEIDGVIDPADTRTWIVNVLRSTSSAAARRASAVRSTGDG